MLPKHEIFDLVIIAVGLQLFVFYFINKRKKGMIFTLQEIIIILCVNYRMLHVKQPDMCLVPGLKQNPCQYMN